VVDGQHGALSVLARAYADLSNECAKSAPICADRNGSPNRPYRMAVVAPTTAAAITRDR
jgi:hypothetical protein